MEDKLKMKCIDGDGRIIFDGEIIMGKGKLVKTAKFIENKYK